MNTITDQQRYLDIMTNCDKVITEHVSKHTVKGEILSSRTLWDEDMNLLASMTIRTDGVFFAFNV